MVADMGRTHQGECGSGAWMAALGAAGVVCLCLTMSSELKVNNNMSHIGQLCSCDVFSVRDAADTPIALQYLSVSIASLALSSVCPAATHF